MNTLSVKLKQLKKDDVISIADAIVAFLLVICPILQHYVGLIVDARATVMLLVTPYLIYRFWIKNEINYLLLLPLIFYCLYKAFADGFNILSLGREGMTCFIIIAVASGIIDIKSFMRFITIIAVVASCLIFIQYFCYYVLGFHLQLVPTSLFLESSDQWIGMAQTGKISIFGNKMRFYRPSSFFLEPSHMTLFCVPPVLLNLISPGFTLRKGIIAAIITLGVVASTSGMGIGLCAGIWMLFFAFYFGEDMGEKPLTFGKIKINGIKLKAFEFKGIKIGNHQLFKFNFKGHFIRPVNMIFVVLLLIAFILAYIFIDVVRDSVNRVILVSDKGYNAIIGRTNSGIKAIKDLHGLEILFGKHISEIGDTGYTAAFFKTFYKYGLVGLIPSYFFYVYSVIKLKRQYFWMAVLVFGISFFSVHTHMLSYMMFLCFILFAGHFENGTANPKQLSLSIHPFGLKKKIETENN